jgi:hypothetical protein
MLRARPVVCGSIAAVFLAGAMAVNAAVTQNEKSTGVVSPTPAAEKTERERKLAAATEAAKQFLLVMDTGKSGKVSKEEWMKFMEAEFDRLDTRHGRQGITPITSPVPSGCRQVTAEKSRQPAANSTNTVSRSALWRGGDAASTPSSRLPNPAVNQNPYAFESNL